MQTRRRSPTPAWHRSPTPPRLQRARRAPGGHLPVAWPPARRRRRAYDGAAPQPVRSRRPTLQRIRRNPIRSGVVGLAIAGTAVPLAVQRTRTALRTNPSHEQTLNLTAGRPLDDSAVSAAWQRAEREQGIQRNLERYADYGISRDLAERIYDQATDAQINPDLAFGLVHAESSFRNSATSNVGAVGLTQLMPSTARWLEPGTSVRDLRDADTNLRIGFQYLKQLMDRYEGDSELALLAYNRGPGTVDRVLKAGGNPDNGYAELVNQRRG